MTYRKGDILHAFKSGELSVLVHQTNCFGNMGAEIALAIKNEYPEVSVLDSVFCEFCKLPFGKILPVVTDKGLIINLYGQLYPGQPSEKTVNSPYSPVIFDNFIARKDALIKGLELISKYVDKDLKIGFPLIASGLSACKARKNGKSDLSYFKEYIEPMIEFYLPNHKIIVYYL